MNSSGLEGHGDVTPLLDTGSMVAGRYRVVQFVSAGGMGEVYEVEDTDLAEHVALKVIRLEIAGEAAALERFRREIQLARRVTHPNVCRIFDVGYHRLDLGAGREMSIPFLTMELLRGETLAGRITREGRLQARDAESIVVQLATGLDAAHRQGIIHRDFKSANVILTEGPESRAVITDFGLARAVAKTGPDATTVTVTGVVLGTPAYLAPEQIAGEELTSAADIYALGVVFYEMLTGQRPFVGDTPLSTALKRLSQNPAAPRTLTPDLPRRLENAVLRCLERAPMDRFQTGADLVRFIRGEPVAGRGRWKRLRVRSAVAAAALTVALVAAIGLWWYSSGRHAQQLPAAIRARRSVAVLQFRSLSGDPDVAWLATGIAEMLGTEIAAGQKLRVIPGEETARLRAELALPDSDSFSADTLARIRADIGADLLVQGSYLSMRGDEQIRIDVRVQDAVTGEIRFAASESGSDLFSTVPRIAAQLRENLGIGELSTPEAEAVRAAQPANAEVARYYSEGLAHMRLSESAEARDLFARAVDAGPSFPLAHAGLSAAWSAMGYDAKAKEEAKKALDLAGGLSREDRLMIEGRYRETTSEYAAAAEIYRTLFGFFPDNLDYGLRLAIVQRSAGKTRDAIATLESLRMLPPPASDDPRIDLAESETSRTLSDYKRQREAAEQAEKKGRAIGARLIVANAVLSKAISLVSQNEYSRAAELFREARRLFEEGGDRTGAARTMLGLGNVLLAQGDSDGASAILHEAMAVYQQTGNRQRIAVTLNSLAWLAFGTGDLPAARSRFEESIQIRREIGDRQGLSTVLGNLGVVARNSGDLAYADKLIEEELAIALEIGNRENRAAAAVHGAGVLIRRGDLQGVRSKCNDALAITREIGDKEFTAVAINMLAQVETCEGRFAEARRHCEEAISAFHSAGMEPSAAEARLTLARIDIEEGRFVEAEQAARQVLTLRDPERGAMASSTLSEALLGQGRVAEAADAVAHVRAHDRELQFDVALAAAKAAAAGGKASEAVRSLNQAIKEARAIGFLRNELEADLALGKIEIQAARPEAGRKRLREIETRARAKGFLLIADQASRAMS